MPPDSQPYEPYDDAGIDGVLKAAFGPEGLPPAGEETVLGVLDRLTGRATRVHLEDLGPHEGPPIQPHTAEGTQLSKQRSSYRILGEIARGGMGVVLRAHDGDLGRDVALKVLHEEARADASLVQRFVEEAQISGQLQHPGVVPVYEIGLMADERPFFAMKLVKGRTLSSLLRERTSPDSDRRRFLSIFEQVGQALAYAHARNVIHRDVKPANVMVGAFGEVQLMDWGLAKVLRTGGVDDEARAREREVSNIATVREAPGSDGTVSRPGSVMGTPAYMSPEQARGQVESVDQRSDVFSLGAILTEILTGRPPYTGTDLLLQASSARLGPALRRLKACGADPELVALARRCLAEDPMERPQNAEVVAREIHDWSASLEDRARKAEIDAARATERAQGERKARKLTVALASVVLLAGAGWLVIRAQQNSRRAELAARVQTAIDEAILAKGSGDADAALAAAKRASDLAGSADVDSELQARVADLLADASSAAQVAREEEARQKRNREFVATLEWLRTMDRTERYEHQLASHAAWPGPGVDLVGRDPHAHGEDGGPAFTTGSRVTGTHASHGSISPSAEEVEPRSEWESRDRAFTAAFQDLGVDLATQTDDHVKAVLDRAGIGVDIALALDSWARVLTALNDDAPSSRTARLFALAKAVDRDPLRSRVRDAIQASDGQALYAIAGGEEVLAHSPVTVYVIATALHDRGANQAAIDLMRRGLERHPGDFLLHVVLSRTLTRVGAAYDEEVLAEAIAGRALRPDSASAWAAVGFALRRLGRTWEAVEVLRRAVQMDPGAGDVHGYLGDALAQAESHSEAAQSYLEAARLSPSPAYYQRLAGSALASAGNYEGALREWRKPIEVDLERAVRRGAWVVAVPDPVALVSAARKFLDKDPAPISSWGLLVHLHFSARDHVTMTAVARQRVARFPSDGASHALLGRVLAEVRDEAGARQALDEALRLAPSDPDVIRARDHTLQLLGGGPASPQPPRKSVPTGSKNEDDWSDFASDLGSRGEYPAAAEALREALRLAPWDHRAILDLVDVLTHLDDLRGARQALEEARIRSPNDPCVLQKLGHLYLQSGDKEAGLENLRQALRAAPHRLDGWARLIGGLLSDGQSEEAAREFAAMVRAVESAGGDLLNYHMSERARVDVLEHCAIECVALAEPLEKGGLHDEARASVALGRRLAPASASVQANAARALIDVLKDPEEALKCLETIVRFCPESPAARSDLGHGLLALGRRAKAAAVWREVLRQAPGSEGTALNLARLVHDERPDEAAEILRESARRNPGSVEVHHRLLHVLTDARKDAEAREVLRELTRLDPGRECLAAVRTTLRTRSGGLEAAESELRQELEEKPDDAVLLGQLARILAKRNRHEESEAAYRRVLERTPDADSSRFNLGSQLAAQGKVAEAETCFRAYIDRHPEDKEDLEVLARVLWVQGKRDEAISWYRRQLESDPESPVYLLYLALNLSRMGAKDEAETLYRKLDSLAPESSRGMNHLAWVFQFMQRYDESIAWYEKSLDLARSPNSLGNQSWNYSMHPDPAKRRPDEAVRLAEEALEADPEHGSWHAHLAIARYRLGDLDGAVKEIERSIELRGECEPVDWLFLAMALKRLGREAEARGFYERGLAWSLPSHRVEETWNFSLADVERTRKEARELFEGK